ncbi:Fic family protein [Roseateles saccharophilus]|uniref:Fic family protein n=1 Tax=Roseateles saccharophilus TaxID=304 RepID=A0A4R3U5I6_ROSSA|nr:Fic family protein [Roseateles saccharophilus]MDG0836238.1 Fic family protein [Roseateles saccharophilus]TCU81289.1 Fic family protein [Roseateles saccharophilus]
MGGHEWSSLGWPSGYSNKIEGEHTRPTEINQALAQDFSANPDKARLQRLAVAHIGTESWLLGRDVRTEQLYTSAAVEEIHAHLFAQLTPEDRVVVMCDDAGLDVERAQVEPGQIRRRDVAVHRHLAPSFVTLPRMMDRWAQSYATVRRGEKQLLAAAAAHHRLVWIHPFMDGNGRTARLHSLAVLHSLGVTQGLWSPLRGFACRSAQYIEHLANADMPRMGDLDGRGQRSERMLVTWIDFFLDVCLDQVAFMSGMLDMGRMRERIRALLAYEQHVGRTGLREEAQMPLHYLFTTGDMARGEFARMTGLGERTAATLVAKLIDYGLLVSDTPKGRVRFGVPMRALRFLFPALWPEAEADVQQANC